VAEDQRIKQNELVHAQTALCTPTGCPAQKADILGEETGAIHAAQQKHDGIYTLSDQSVFGILPAHAGLLDKTEFGLPCCGTVAGGAGSCLCQQSLAALQVPPTVFVLFCWPPRET